MYQKCYLADIWAVPIFWEILRIFKKMKKLFPTIFLNFLKFGKLKKNNFCQIRELLDGNLDKFEILYLPKIGSVF